MISYNVSVVIKPTDRNTALWWQQRAQHCSDLIDALSRSRSRSPIDFKYTEKESFNLFSWLPLTFLSLITMSSRAEISALMPHSRNNARVTIFKLYLRLYRSRGVKNVIFKLPRSWKTVPPPLFRRAKVIPAFCKCETFVSSNGF